METTWLEDVKKVLKQLGEPAHLSIICPRVFSLRGDLSNNNFWEETVRTTLNSHYDEFVSYGRGVWGINYETKKDNRLPPGLIEHIQSYYELIKKLIDVMDKQENHINEYELKYRADSDIPDWYIKDMDAEIKKHKIERSRLNATIIEVNNRAKKNGLKKFEEYLISGGSVIK